MIPFNQPYLSGKEKHYIHDAVVNERKISGNGKFSKLCHGFFESKYGFKKTLLTTSCTDALEMCAVLLDIKPGDEVIVPSFTFVSTALAFARQGAKIVFADSSPNSPNIDETKIEALITKNTKAIVVVHYAGVACNMDVVMEIADKYKLFVVEDAAQAIDSYYKGKPLGGIGHLGCFSFHETKNIQCGEGGLLIINDERFVDRSEIIWEKGTNRAKFFRGEIDKYGWVDTGSSFLLSDLNAAYLFAQLENISEIQEKRKNIWDTYYNKLNKHQNFYCLSEKSTLSNNNGHMFYLIINENRDAFIDFVKSKKVNAVFHYQALHKSQYGKIFADTDLPRADFYSENLVRLPLFFELKEEQIDYICKIIIDYHG